MVAAGRKCNRRPFLPNSGALLGVQMFPVCASPRLILSTGESRAIERANVGRRGDRGRAGGAAGFRGTEGRK